MQIDMIITDNSYGNLVRFIAATQLKEKEGKKERNERKKGMKEGKKE